MYCTRLFACLAAMFVVTPATSVVAGVHSETPGPIGVMGEHSHPKRGWMLSYRYMQMFMKGNLDGSKEQSAGEVLARGFMVTPRRMSTEMHMFGVMFAPDERITLTLMFPFVSKSMDHLARNGAEFTTRSQGLGDLRFGGLIKLFEGGGQHLLLNAALGIPTGSIRRKDKLPGTGKVQLPYPMQIGSGTWDFFPGLTYTGHRHRISWGAQAMGTLRAGENRNEYRLGHRVGIDGWGAFGWTDWLSTSARLSWKYWGNLHGRDEDLLTPPTAVPTADPKRRAGQRLEVGLGLNLLGTGGWLRNHELAFEVLLPAYQSLDGPQLATRWTVVTGWRWTF